MSGVLPEKYKNAQPPLKFTEEAGELTRNVKLDFRDQADWKIPEEVVISVAPVGAFVDKEQNPNQPSNPQEISDTIVESIDSGAVGAHIHARDEKGKPTAGAKYFHEIVDPVRRKFGKNVVIDGGCMTGKTFQETMTPIVEHIYDIGIVNPTTGLLGNTIRAMLPGTMIAQAEFFQENGVKAMIDIHDSSSINNAKRYLIDTGIIKKPYMFHILPGIPGTFSMDNSYLMVKGLLYLVETIKDIDKDAFITVSESGRASTYLITMAMLLGLNVRVGMEDIVYKYPHTRQMVQNNPELVRHAVEVAKSLGRKPATAEQYRKMAGIQ